MDMETITIRIETGGAVTPDRVRYLAEILAEDLLPPLWMFDDHDVTRDGSTVIIRHVTDDHWRGQCPGEPGYEGMRCYLKAGHDGQPHDSLPYREGRDDSWRETEWRAARWDAPVMGAGGDPTRAVERDDD